MSTTENTYQPAPMAQATEEDLALAREVCHKAINAVGRKRPIGAFSEIAEPIIAQALTSVREQERDKQFEVRLEGDRLRARIEALEQGYAEFNYPNILQEAIARLVEARQHLTKFTPEKDTLEYWCAWAAHENANQKRNI